MHVFTFTGTRSTPGRARKPTTRLLVWADGLSTPIIRIMATMDVFATFRGPLAEARVIGPMTFVAFSSKLPRARSPWISRRKRPLQGVIDGERVLHVHVADPQLLSHGPFTFISSVQPPPLAAPILSLGGL